MAKKPPKIRVSQELRRFFQKIGKRGGKVGGKRAAERMTTEQKRERARKAALARWDKLRLP
jgi:hypothetical protein